MNDISRKIIASAILLAAGILAVVFPVFSGVLSVAVASLGICYAFALWILDRTVFRYVRMKPVLVAAIVTALFGVLLLVNNFVGFADVRFLLLAELAAVGLVTVGLGIKLKSSGLPWISVIVAGGGMIAAGLLSLAIAEAAITAGCVTAIVIILRPLVLQAVESGKAKKADREAKGKIVTVREKDIEIIEEGDDEKE